MKVLIIGATGLVGKEITKQALESSEVSSVVVFVRRPMKMMHAKLNEHVVDFNDVNSWKDLLHGDVLFSTMGTTIKAAGSKEAQYKVDYEYQYNVAATAKENGVSSMVVISSSGADAHSPFFYLKTKGELEVALKELKFKSLVILRPGLLEGDREENRTAEKYSHLLLSKVPKLKIFAKFLPAPGHQVAAKSLEAAKQCASGVVTLEASDILFN